MRAMPDSPRLPAASLKFHTAPGFTLFELLVVVLIIAIIVSFISLSAFRKEDPAKNEATKLAALLNVAGDEAVLTGQSYAVSLNEKGYTFLVQSGNDSTWRPLENDDLLWPREFPPEVAFRLLLEGDEQGRREDGSAGGHRIYLTASGEITPFTMILSTAGSAEDHILKSFFPGKVKLVSADEAAR